MINILIRTSYRPIQFARCLDSVLSQHNIDTNIIVGYDNERALEYILKTGVNATVSVSSMGVGEFKYNEYLNRMLSCSMYCKSHIIFLDDDDILLPGLSDRIGDQLDCNSSYIFPFIRQPYGLQKPSHYQMIQKIIIKGYIGLPCLVLAADHRKFVTFDGTEYSDYNAIKKLSRTIKLKWINIPLVEASTRSRGAMEK